MGYIYFLSQYFCKCLGFKTNATFQYIPQSNARLASITLDSVQKLLLTAMVQTQAGWQVGTKEEDAGVRYVISLPVDHESVEMVSPLTYESREEAIREGEKLIVESASKVRSFRC